jgi:F-type H+-transporting ATPase subunit b
MRLLGVLHLIAEGVPTTDPDGHITTSSAILPETVEIFAGGLASLIVFGLLYWKGWPAIKKAMDARTERIQKELDSAAADRAAAAAEASNIRQAKGDIAAERARLLGEAETQAAAVLADGRARLTQELAELEAKAMSDIAASQGRVGDELRAEIARLSVAAVDHVVSGSLDDATQQQLIEDFIARVGVGS